MFAIYEYKIVFNASRKADQASGCAHEDRLDPSPAVHDFSETSGHKAAQWDYRSDPLILSLFRLAKHGKCVEKARACTNSSLEHGIGLARQAQSNARYDFSMIEANGTRRKVT